MHNLQANAPLLEEADRSEESDRGSEEECLQTDEPHNHDDHEPRFNDEPQQQELHGDVNIFKRIGSCGCSPIVMICISHALSAWGDRMWMFAISVFLIALTPDSFLLTAIYGLSVSLSVVAFGTLVGDWIDITPRLKAARLTLVIQNVAVVACAVVVLIMFEGSFSKAVFVVLAVVLVLLAIVARLSSVGTSIAIERDWVVVIAQENEFLLAETNAILRRIDLTCNILAPVSTGLIINFGSIVIGILFIAGWNIASVFVEYAMLSSVYRSCPALANKTVDVSRLEGNVNDSEQDENIFNDYLLEEDGGTVLVSRVKSSGGFKYNCSVLVDKVKSRARVLRFGLKVFFQQRVAFAGIGLSCLYLTVLGFDSITTAYAYSQHVSALVLGVLTAAGALTGISGTFIFPRFREKFGLVKTGLISNSIQLFFLMFCVASVWAPGHPGHVLDLNYHDQSGKTGVIKHNNISLLPTTSLVNTVRTLPSNFTEQSTVTFTLRPTVTVYPSLPFSVLPISNSSSFIDSKNILPSTASVIHLLPSSATLAMNISNIGGNNTKKNSSKNSKNNEAKNSITSLGLLMGGIVLSRIGLWMTDLTVTQLFQENVPEQERGIVSGVQNSFNSIMDVAHFVMVTVAPRPEDFGVLILISVAMVSIGFLFYSRFAWNHRRRLMQLEKLSHWSASNESVEGTSRRLRDESSDVSSGVLSVKNDNYSLEL